jgi:hypothetical protein
MRFFEFSRNLTLPVLQNPADDLAYLISNTNLSPDILKLISSTLKTLVNKNQDDQDNDAKNIKPPEPLKPQPKTQEPQPSTPQTNNQNTQEPTDKLKESSTEAMENELLDYLKQVKQTGTQDKELSKLLYQVRDVQFKKMTSAIISAKFKDKNRESYELVKKTVRSLSTKIPVDVMTQFLQDCLNGGIIDTPSMISGETKSTSIPISNPNYETVARAFLDLNLERLGRGEIGLAFMGIETIKQSSDLLVENANIEVKASKDTDFYLKGNPDEGGFGNQAKAVSTLTKALNRAGANFKSHNKSRQGGLAAIGRTNINSINDYFKNLGRKETVQTLVEVLKELNFKSPEIVDQYDEDILKAVNEDGSVNYNLLSLATAKINFDYYKEMSGHEGILVLNLGAFQYIYINNADTWADKVKNNILQQMYAIDFRSNGLGGIAYIINDISKTDIV